MKETINRLFSHREKIDYLVKQGFDVRREEVMMAYDVYHNDVEYEKVWVDCVYLNDKEFGKPCYRNFYVNAWVEEVFCNQIIEKFSTFLLNL